MTRLGLLLAGLAVAVLPLAAQEPTPRFEVASIKPNVGPSPFSGANIRRDSFSATYYSVSQLIQLAYGVRDHQILNGPEWIRSERFDVAAKASTEVPREQALRMVQALLADRFKLRVRNESRELTILELRLAQDDGRVGPNLHDCSKPQDGPPEKPFVAPTGGSAASADCGPGLSYLLNLVSRELDAMVVDKTGLTGQWRYNIFFAAAISPVLDGPPNLSLPTFAAALHEQLGLRTERTRAPIPVMVIDSVERPTPD